MSFAIKLSVPTQCESQTLTWSGPAVTKGIGMWVQSTDYFAEIVRENLTDTLGTVDWVCDVPAGAWIAFEVFSLVNTSDWAASAFFQVQPGSTDSCLRTNEGQQAVASMSALASSLSSASPQLFTYAATKTSGLSSPATQALASSTASAPAPTESASSSSLNVGALVGGIAGGVAGVLALASILFLFFRRRARLRLRGSKLESSSRGETEMALRPGSAPMLSTGNNVPDGVNTVAGVAATKGFFRSMSRSVHPVDAWRKRVLSGAPPSVARTRALSYDAGAAPDWHGPDEFAGILPGPPTSSSKDNTAADALRTGPRTGVPEVGEGGDFDAYRRGDLQALQEARGYPYSGFSHPATASVSATHLMSYGGADSDGAQGEVGRRTHNVPRPPTRLTTPGGLSDGGPGLEEAALSAGGSDPEHGAGYASYTRVV